MDDTAQELGISKKTLYQFVKDKHELVCRTIEFEENRRKQILEEIINHSEDIIDKFFRLFHVFIDYIKSFNPAIEYDLIKYYPELYHKAKDVWKNNVTHSFKEVVSKGKKEGLFRKSIDVSLFARMFLFGLEQLQQNNIITIEEFNSKEFTNQVLEYHMNAICTPWGIESFNNYKQKINP